MSDVLFIALRGKPYATRLECIIQLWPFLVYYNMRPQPQTWNSSSHFHSRRSALELLMIIFLYMHLKSFRIFLHAKHFRRKSFSREKNKTKQKIKLQNCVHFPFVPIFIHADVRYHEMKQKPLFSWFQHGFKRFIRATDEIKILILQLQVQR